MLKKILSAGERLQILIGIENWQEFRLYGTTRNEKKRFLSKLE